MSKAKGLITNMRIIFMGTPDFAVPCLKALIDNNHEIACVITQPDRPKGRGNKLTPPPVKEFALQYGLEVFQPEKVRTPEAVEKIKSYNSDIIVVVAFGQILPPSILNIPKYGCINVHASLLPKFRGASPIHWSIISGEKTTGVTTMFMDEGMDTGDMLLKSETPIYEKETTQELHDRLSQMGAELLIKTIRQIESGQITRIPQDSSDATYTKLLTKEMGNIDWTKSAVEIKNLVRGTYPWPGAYTYYEGEKFKIFSVETAEQNKGEKPGAIIEVTKNEILVQSGNGIVILKDIQAENGKRMSVEEYLRGHSIQKNKCFSGDNNGAAC